MEGKTVLITGGFSPLGAAIARRLAARRTRLVLHSSGRRQAGHAALLRAVRGLGALSARAVSADFSQPAGIERMFADLRNRRIVLDVLVNNAGILFRRPLAETSPQDALHVLRVNTLGPLRCMQLAVAAGATRIVNVLDVAADKSWRNHGLYCASKAALATLTRVAAVEFAPAVRVNAVAPGLVTLPPGDEETYRPVLARIPMGRPGLPDEVARVVEMLLDAPEYVTGQVVAVDGGLSLR